ncbi:hypothetical protein [Mucilaginibacter sp.]|uniref:hypothetical protein n=1 Tax=Mucilaginibacter sp. TaxID=1882438 RepID=UPI003AFFAED6
MSQQTTTSGAVSDTPASDANVNKSCVITNNTSIAVLVLDAQGDDVVPMQIGYEQNLNSMASSDGYQSLDTGKTLTYILNDWYTDEDKTQQYSTNYQFILATLDCLYPVKMTHAHYNLRPKPHTYDPIIIAQADFDNMKLAEQFQQTLMAYPSSTLSKSYQNAMSGATDSSGTIEDIDTAVNSFFATTKEYKNVTLSMITAISTYYSQYPYVWGGYQGSKTYYLYGSDGDTVTYQGSVQIKVDQVLPARTDKDLPYFTLTFTDADNKSKPLYYVGGQFVDDKAKDIPTVCLSGTFVAKSTLTKVATDTAMISILSGTVNGVSVLGYDQKQNQDKDGNWSGLYTLLHPKDAMGWMSLFMTATGLFMGLEMVYRGLEGLKDRLFKKRNSNTDQSDPNEIELEQIRTDVKSDKTAKKGDYQELLDKMDKQLEMAEDLSAKMDDFQNKVTDQLNEDQRSNLEDGLVNQSDAAGRMLEYGNPPSMKKVSTDIDKTYDTLDNLPTEELAFRLPDITYHITNVINVNFNNEVQRVMEGSIAQEVRDAMSNAQESAANAEETGSKIEENKTNNENGEVPEDLDFKPHEFQPGIFE